MDKQLKIFLSHSHLDDTFARELAGALRQAGADVWYDEHNLGSGRLGPVIEQELHERPIFIVALSPVALASQWVEDECRWSYELLRDDSTRTILPVTVAPIADKAAIWLFLRPFKRIEASDLKPFPTAEAIRHTLIALALMPPGGSSTFEGSQSMEDAAELVTRGKAINAQGKHSEALEVFSHATRLDPKNRLAWENLGSTLTCDLDRHEEAVKAFDTALSLDPSSAFAWKWRGYALHELKRYKEAVISMDHALATDSKSALAWKYKANALVKLERYEEALTASERALARDPKSVFAWTAKGKALFGMHKCSQAIEAFNIGLGIDPKRSSTQEAREKALKALAEGSCS